MGDCAGWLRAASVPNALESYTVVTLVFAQGLLKQVPALDMHVRCEGRAPVRSGSSLYSTRTTRARLALRYIVIGRTQEIAYRVSVFAGEMDLIPLGDVGLALAQSCLSWRSCSPH